MNKSCLICKSSKNRVIFNEFGIDILRCLGCGHVFSSYERKQDYDGYFGCQSLKQEEYFWWNKARQKMYHNFCSKFIAGKSGKLLDVGCGMGYFVKYLSSFSPSWQVFGYEISQQAVEYTQDKLGLKNIFCGRVEKSDFEKKSFDIITLWDVLEHLSNPDVMLSYLNSILKDEGMLFIHTPNINIQLLKAKLKKFFFGLRENLHYLEAKDHLNIYSPKTIKILLNRSGFNRIKFIHLEPIQSVSGSKNRILKFVKNLWSCWARLLFYLTLGKINLDNLFVLARKH